MVTFFAPKKLPKRCKGSALDPWGDLVTMGVAPRSFDRWLVCTCSKWFSLCENQTLVHNFIVCGGGFHLSVIVRWYSTTHNAFNLPRSFLCYAQSMGDGMTRTFGCDCLTLILQTNGYKKQSSRQPTADTLLYTRRAYGLPLRGSWISACRKTEGVYLTHWKVGIKLLPSKPISFATLLKEEGFEICISLHLL